MPKEEYEKITKVVKKFLENVVYVNGVPHVNEPAPKENSSSNARSSEGDINNTISNVVSEVNASPPKERLSSPTASANVEKDKLTKMKQRKEARKERAEKKIKTVTVEEDQEKPYDIEKILEALGEVNYLVIFI